MNDCGTHPAFDNSAIGTAKEPPNSWFYLEGLEHLGRKPRQPSACGNEYGSNRPSATRMQEILKLRVYP